MAYMNIFEAEGSRSLQLGALRPGWNEGSPLLNDSYVVVRGKKKIPHLLYLLFILVNNPST